MTNSSVEFIELSIFDEILNGRLRPFFVDSLSCQEINNILSEIVQKDSFVNIESDADACITDGLFAKPSSNLRDDIGEKKVDVNYYNKPICEGPFFSVKKSFDYDDESDESSHLEIDSDKSRTSRIDNKNKIGSDQFCQLNSKTEQIKAIIQKANKCTEQRVTNLKRVSDSEDDLRIVANRYIERAKELAADAAELSGLFKKEDPKRGYPNASIVDMVRSSLIHSIELYQLHFRDYIDHQLISNDDLDVLSDQGQPIRPIAKRFEKEHFCSNNELVKTSSASVVQTFSDVKKNGNRFILKGEFWEISYGKAETNMNNLERIRYIVRLLESPNQDFYCHELVSLVKGIDPDICLTDHRELDPIESDDKADDWQSEIHFVDPTEDEISRKDLDACINVAMDLWQEANEINVPESELENAKEDWEKAKKHFRNEYGLFFIETKKGGLRAKVLKRLNRDAEKSRTNVKKQISKAISDIAKKIPSFSIYLENHIQTGIKCTFKPDPEDMSWTIEWGN